MPGTGKSIATEAITKAMGKRVIQVSYSSLMGSLQRNTEKI
ncbi:AAA family ATPase [uncultured Parabacteroides sp.]